MTFLTCNDPSQNFWTQNPSKSSKVSKDLDFSLVPIKTRAKYYRLAVWAQGQMKSAKKA